jgi:hypothetical protein
MIFSFMFPCSLIMKLKLSLRKVRIKLKSLICNFYWQRILTLDGIKQLRGQFYTLSLGKNSHFLTPSQG